MSIKRVKKNSSQKKKFDILTVALEQGDKSKLEESIDKYNEENPAEQIFSISKLVRDSVNYYLEEKLNTPGILK